MMSIVKPVFHFLTDSIVGPNCVPKIGVPLPVMNKSTEELENFFISSHEFEISGLTSETYKIIHSEKKKQHLFR